MNQHLDDLRHGAYDLLLDLVAKPVAGRHGHVVVHVEVNVDKDIQGRLAREDHFDVQHAWRRGRRAEFLQRVRWNLRICVWAVRGCLGRATAP